MERSVGAFGGCGLGWWAVVLGSFLWTLVMKFPFFLEGAEGSPTSAQPSGVFTAISWSEQPRRDCSCRCAARQSLPIRRIVGQSGFLAGKFGAKSANSEIVCTSSLEGMLFIWDGMLCCITVGGSWIDVDSSSGLTFSPFVILQGASVEVPCMVIVASLDGRR